MEMKAQKMSVCNMVYATERAKRNIQAILDHAEEVKSDRQKNQRMSAHKCISCFYGSGIGCSAITSRPCMSCGENQMYGSTYTDVLCLVCAKKHNLCKHCGGDIDMKTRRKEWPR